MTNSKTIIVASIIIGLSILGYGYMDYTYKLKTLEAETQLKQQAEAQKTIEEATEYEKRAKVEECQQNVRAKFTSTDIKGITLAGTELLLQLMQDELDNCIKLYK